MNKEVICKKTIGSIVLIGAYIPGETYYVEFSLSGDSVYIYEYPNIQGKFMGRDTFLEHFYTPEETINIRRTKLIDNIVDGKGI